jgi:hypothetical protein
MDSVFVLPVETQVGFLDWPHLSMFHTKKDRIQSPERRGLNKRQDDE